jgi:hypothetical protein
MHAGLDLGLGLGSHAGQGTRDGLNTVLISDREQSAPSQNTGCAIRGDIACDGELFTFCN